jgi:hypothetical protein
MSGVDERVEGGGREKGEGSASVLHIMVTTGSTQDLVTFTIQRSQLSC